MLVIQVNVVSSQLGSSRWVMIVVWAVALIVPRFYARRRYPILTTCDIRFLGRHFKKHVQWWPTISTVQVGVRIRVFASLSSYVTTLIIVILDPRLLACDSKLFLTKHGVLLAELRYIIFDAVHSELVDQSSFLPDCACWSCWWRLRGGWLFLRLFLHTKQLCLSLLQ